MIYTQQQELNVISVTHNPKFIPLIFKNFKRQKYYKKKLIIVENGNAIGTCKKLNLIPDVLLSSENNQSIAKNTALDYLKKGFFVTFDDDDYYGFNYLNEIIENITKAEIIGKHKSFLNFNNNLYLLNGLNENSFTNMVHGPTISSWIEISEYFRVVNSGEDGMYLEDMSKKGCKIYATSKNNFSYSRNGNHHTYKIKINQFFHKLKDWYPDFNIKYCPYNEDIINGKQVSFKEYFLDRNNLTIKDFDDISDFDIKSFILNNI